MEVEEEGERDGEVEGERGGRGKKEVTCDEALGRAESALVFFFFELLLDGPASPRRPSPRRLCFTHSPQFAY